MPFFGIGTINIDTILNSDDYAFFIVQRFYEEDSWKRNSLSEDIALIFLNFIENNINTCIEELAIKYDLIGITFIHDKAFVDFLFLNLKSFICSSKYNCIATQKHYLKNIEEMHLKFLSLQK